VSKTIDQLIAEANLRLKAARTGLIIKLRYTNKLSLRGQLPPRPGSEKLEKYSQRLTLKYLGNAVGIALAEADALNITSQLIKEKFNWADWIEVWTPQTAIIADLLERHKAKYLTKNSETSYHNYYLACYKWLPIDEPLTVKAIAPSLTRHAQDSRSRAVTFIAATVLVKLTEVDLDLEPYKSTYTARQGYFILKRDMRRDSP